MFVTRQTYSAMNIKSAVIFLLALSSTIVWGQDSAHKISTHVGAEFWGTYLNYPYNPAIHRAAYLQKIDRLSYSGFDSLKDSPLKHGAYYAALKTTTTFSPGIKLIVDIYGEHRGISYGIYNKQNVVIYPIFLLQVKDSISFLKHKFIIEGRAGDFLNMRLDEGLFLYNIDGQGAEGSITLGKWKMSGAWYGDFSRGIGLNIDDAIAVSLSRRFGKQNSWVVGGAVYSLFPPYKSKFDHFYYSAFFRRTFSNAYVYAQVGYQGNRVRENLYRGDILSRMALVAGAGLTHHVKKFTLKAELEIRYYGSSINHLHSDKKVRYRDFNSGLYANTVGDYLYPLRRYDNAFSQWAVFTEYSRCDVFSASLSGNMGYAVTGKTGVALEYDINYIGAVENRFFSNTGLTSHVLYPFVTASYYYSPIKNFKADLMLSNKGMNLDLSYPAFHQFSRLHTGFRIRCSL